MPLETGRKPGMPKCTCTLGQPTHCSNRKMPARTAEQMARRGIKDAYIPFTNQGIFVFKVCISKQQQQKKKSVKSDFTDLSL